MKLTKALAKQHQAACALLEKDTLNFEQREFVLEHWHPGAEHDQGPIGAFFTPMEMAETFAVECNGAQSVIDLCAGIGGLAYHRWLRDRPRRLVCVERNPAYVAVGRKVLPEAEWIQASIFDLPDLGRFDLATSNPPYGRVRCPGQGPRYRGGLFEYRVIDVASTLAEQGVFLIPNTSSPCMWSGCADPKQQGDRKESEEYQRFHRETGITLDIGVGIDTSQWRKDWKGTNVVLESVRVDFRDRRMG